MPYGYYVLLAALAGCVFFLIRAKRRGLPVPAALAAFASAAAGGAVGAKVLYVLMMAHKVFPRYGLEAFLRFTPDSFCFVGGAAAAVGCAALCTRLLRKGQTAAMLDALAPAGALVIAILRLGELQLGTLGFGSLVSEGAPLRFFPFAVANDYGEWYMAVFMLEALIALIIAVLFTLYRPKHGSTFGCTAFALALTQILCENLRKRGMLYGFVHAEQILCLLVLLALTIAACHALPGQLKPLRRYAPAGGILLSVGLIVAEEFARQKSGTQFFSDWGQAFLVLILAGMGLLYASVLRRLPAKH